MVLNAKIDGESKIPILTLQNITSVA